MSDFKVPFPAAASDSYRASPREAPDDANRLAHTVHFAGLRGHDPRRPNAPAQTPSVFWQGSSFYVTLFVIYTAYFITRGISSLLGGPPWLAHATMGATGVAVVTWSLARARTQIRLRAAAKRSGADQTDERFRVRCVGWKPRRERLDRLGAVQDRPFEPRIFPGFFAVSPSKGLMWAWGSLLSVFIVAAVAVVAVRPGLGDMISGYQMPFAAFLASAILFLACPTYFRIDPGRIEVLHYSAFTRRARRCEAHDLRTARVLVDLNTRQLIIEPPGTVASLDGVTCFWFGWMPRSDDFAHAVLEAAISTAPTPPLPEDELVG